MSLMYTLRNLRRLSLFKKRSRLLCHSKEKSLNNMELSDEVITALNIYQNPEHLPKLLQVMTTPPLFTSLRFDTNQISAEEALKAVNLCLDQQNVATGIKKFDVFLHADLKDCLIIRNRGPFVPERAEKEVVVDLACGMSVMRGAHVYKQGILGAPMALEEGETVSVFADIDKKCLKGMTSKYTGKTAYVGNGIMQISRANLFSGNQSQSGIGILMTKPVYEAPCLSELSFKWLFAQNLPSIACVHTLDPQPGENVLDMCAAPGGKTAHIAACMRYKGNIIALEKSTQRAKKMELLNLNNVQIYICDSIQALSKDSVELQHDLSAPPYPPLSFDRILVDAPCSALGQRPCLINRISANQLKSYPVIQHKLLMIAADLLKPGGVLVYSTCTITVEENENQVAKLLSKRPDIKLSAPPIQLGACGLVGSVLSETERSLVQRFDPSVMLTESSVCSQESHNVDTIGFFIAKFAKMQYEGENT